jgi:outer membrane immunogenic protein
MKKYLLSSVAALGLVAAGAASAADLPSRKGPVVAPVYAPIFTWTGFYVGVNAGYGFGNYDVKGAVTNTIGDPDGFIGGAQVGYNYQFGQFVAGLETDLQYSDMKSSRANLIGGTNKGELEYFGTVRARFGVAYDRFLPYITGGFAYGQNKVTVSGLGISTSDDNTHFGYTVGAGLEYAFTNNLTAKIEYLYTDLGEKRYFSAAGVGTKIGNDFSVVRAGLNYKF